MCAGMRVCVYVCMCRPQVDVAILLYCSSLCFLRQGLLMNLVISDGLDRLAKKLWKSVSSLRLSHAQFTQLHLSFDTRTEDPDSGPLARVAGTSSTELPP